MAKKSLVFFVKGALKTTVMEQWTKWEETSRAPADQRPSERPLPWKLQVANASVAYLKDRFTGMHNEVVDLASTLPTVVNAVSHPKLKSDASAVWPIQVVLRDSEGAQKVKDAWLSEQFHSCMGRDYDLGVKASRHQPGMTTRLVLKGLGEDVLAKERVRDPVERVTEVRHRDAALNASRRVGVPDGRRRRGN